LGRTDLNSSPRSLSEIPAHVSRYIHAMKLASSVLDIDLDYFGLVKEPVQRLRKLLSWAGCPVSVVVDEHHHALREWRRLIARGGLAEPGFILHVDEHHDMMDEQSRPSVSNVMYHAMRTWDKCRVHWLTVSPIDSPAMWLSEETWSALRKRFSMSSRIPPGWPRPDLASVTRSPEFVSKVLADRLLGVIKDFR